MYWLLRTDFTTCPSVVIVDFEQVSASWEAKRGINYNRIYLLTILTWKTLCFTEKIHWNTRLAACDVFVCLHNQLSSFNSIIVRMSVKRDSSSIYSKNEWLVLSVTFTAKLELVFVLTFENAFLSVFILKPTERA